MKKKVIRRAISIILVGGLLAGIIFYKPIEEYLIEQSANPTGLVGDVMMKIWNRTYEGMSNWGIDKIDINEDDYILDVGCGGGKTIYNLSSEVTTGKIFGIDISEDAVESSINENKKDVEDGKVEILKADVAYLPFEDESFNKVMAMQTHIYWDEVEKGFEEIFRVLKKDGQLLIVCEKDKIEYHLKEEYKKNDATKELLYKIGFSEVRVEENRNWISFICRKS